MLVYDEGCSKPRKIRARPPAASDTVVPADAFLERSTRAAIDEDDQYRSGAAEVGWEQLDQSEQLDAVDRAVAAIKATQIEDGKDEP